MLHMVQFFSTALRQCVQCFIFLQYSSAIVHSMFHYDIVLEYSFETVSFMLYWYRCSPTVEFRDSAFYVSYYTVQFSTTALRQCVLCFILYSPTVQLRDSALYVQLFILYSSTVQLRDSASMVSYWYSPTVQLRDSAFYVHIIQFYSTV